MKGICKFNPNILCEVRLCDYCGWRKPVRDKRLEEIRQQPWPMRGPKIRMIDADRLIRWLEKENPDAVEDVEKWVRVHCGRTQQKE